MVTQNMMQTQNCLWLITELNTQASIDMNTSETQQECEERVNLLKQKSAEQFSTTISDDINARIAEVRQWRDNLLKEQKLWALL